MKTHQRSFASGEISPALYGRTDLGFSDDGLSYAKNVVIRKTGALVKRAGLEYVGPAASNTSVSRLIPYNFGLSQTYVIELSDQKIRFIQNGGIVESSGSPVEVTSPYLEADLFDVSYASARDVTYLAHKDYAPRTLTRTAANAFTLAAFSAGISQAAPTGLSSTYTSSGSFTAPGNSEYVVTAVSATGEESVASSSAADTETGLGFNDLSWTVASGAVSYNVYKTTATNDAYGYIGIAETNAFRDTGVSPDGTDRPPKERDPFSTADDYPGAVFIHTSQRLIWAATNNNPNILEMSRAGLFANYGYSQPTLPTDAISYPPSTRQTAEIVGMIEIGTLICLTTNGPITIRGTENGALTQGGIQGRPRSERGAAKIPPVVIGDHGLFVQDDRRTLRNLVYQLRADGVVDDDVTAMSDHLFGLDEGSADQEIVDMAYAEHPDSVLYVVLRNGAAVGLTYIPLRDGNIISGFTRIDTRGAIESVAVIKEGTRSVPYFTVKRTLNGSVARTMERMFARDTEDLASGRYLDCALVYSGAATTSVTGLTHLEGETVTALADGDVIENLTVTSGAITLPSAASEVVVGLPYETEIRSLPLQPADQSGSYADREKRVRKIKARLRDTVTLQAGVYDPDASDGGDLEQLLLEIPENWGDPLRRQNKWVEFSVDAASEGEAMVRLVSATPTHFELTGLMVEFSVSSE